MKNNIFLITLSKISKKDFKSFYKYSTKQYEIDSAANQVLQYLKKFYPDFDRYELEEREAFKRIFKGEKFNKSKIQNALYDLNRYLKDFLLLEYMKKSPFEKASALKKVYEELKLDKLAQEQHKKMNAALEVSNENEVWHWVKKLQVSHESYFNLNLGKIALEGSKIKDVITELDNFYALAKIKYACEVYNRAQIINEPPKPIQHLDSILNKDWRQISLIHFLYQTCLKLIQTREDFYYFELKKIITKQKDNINQDFHILITYLINHTAYHIRRGNQIFGREAFELFKYRIEDNSLLVKGFFDINHFANIVDLSSALGEFKWCEDFINQHQDKLKQNTRVLVLEFCFAVFHFWKKDFDETLNLLNKNFKENTFFDIKTRLIRLACKYELNENIEHILSECNATEIYARRNLTAHLSIKKATLNFISILKKIISFQPNREVIHSKLDSKEFILYKSWLLKKIEELN